MKTESIVMCVVSLILGMLLANMFKDVCGCNIVEGGGNGMPVVNTHTRRHSIADFSTTPSSGSVPSQSEYGVRLRGKALTTELELAGRHLMPCQNDGTCNDGLNCIQGQCR